MFSQKWLLAGVFLLFPLAYVANKFDNAGMVLVVWEGFEIRIFEYIGTGAFVIAAGCLGLFLLSVFVLGILPNMPGLDNGQERKVSLSDFTIDELREMDREDEEVHNREWRSRAIASWDGGYNKPSYEDYRGYLRDAFTDRIICNNHTDKRRVVGGKVVRFGGKEIE